MWSTFNFKKWSEAKTPTTFQTFLFESGYLFIYLLIFGTKDGALILPFVVIVAAAVLFVLDRVLLSCPGGAHIYSPLTAGI